MIKATHKATAVEPVRNKSTWKTIVGIVVCIAICATAVIGGLKYTSTSNTGVEIIEFDSIAQLYTVPADVITASEKTLYKVGEDYYSYFPSTGKLELVSQVKDYDTMSLDVLDKMYTGMNKNDTDGQIVLVEEQVEVTETFGNAIDTRTDYVLRELDNCNANLLLNAEDADLLAYKEQLESELNKLVEYRVSLTEQMPVILSALESDEAAQIIAIQISEQMDSAFVDLLKTYNLATMDDVSALERAVVAQQQAIDVLNAKYTDLEEILVNKRVAIEGVQNLIDTPEMQNVIAALDTRVQTYVEQCNAEVVELTTKVTALEKLYNTVTNYNDSNYDIVLSEIRTQYTDLVNEQSNIYKRIQYLEEVTSINTENTSTTDDGMSAVLSTELAQQKEQVTAITNILNSTNLEDIDKLAAEQERLRAYIDELEKTQTLLNETLTEEQLAALTEVKTGLEELIKNSVNDVNELNTAKVSEYTESLSENIAALDADTKAALDNVRELLNSADASQSDALNSAVADLLAKLDASVLAQEGKLEEQRVALSNLVTTTATQVQSDMMTALDDSIVNQENKLAAEKAVLETLISTTNSDLHTELTTLMSDTNAETLAKVTQLDAETESQINDVITMLTDNSVSQETKLNTAVETLETLIGTTNADTVSKVEQLDTETAQKIADVITALENSSDNQDTKLTDAVAALQTLINTTNADTVSKVEQLDTETTQKITDVITALENSNTTQDIKLTDAVATLQTLIDTTNADTVSKVTQLDSTTTQKITEIIALIETESVQQDGNLEDAITALETLIAETNTATNERVGALDTSTTEKITNVIALIESENSVQDGKLDTAIETLEDLISTTNTATNERVGALDTATTQKIADVVTLLESETATQENKLNTAVTELQTLVDNKHNSAVILVEQLDSTTKTKINDVITLLETTNDAQDVKVNNAITDLTTQLETSITAQETQLATDKAALETMITAKTEKVRTDLTAVMDTVDAETKASIEDVLTQLDTVDTTQTASLNKAVKDAEDALAASVADTEEKIATEKQLLTALILEEDAELKTTLTTAITDSKNTVSSETDTKIQNVLTLMDEDNAEQDEALADAVSDLQTELSTSITQQESKLANEKAVLSTLITTESTTLRTELTNSLSNVNKDIDEVESDVNSLNTQLYNVTGDITDLNVDITKVTGNVNTLSSDLSTLNNDVTQLATTYSTFIATDYANYTSNTNTALSDLRTAANTLSADYATYKSTSGNKITEIEALLDVANSSISDNSTEISTLATGLDTLKTTSTTNLNALRTETNAAISVLETSVSADYAAVTADIATLNTKVADLTTLTSEHSAAISNLQTSMSELSTKVTDIETDIDSIYSLLDEKVSVDEIQDYINMGTASTTEIGGVKVDGTTITISDDGTISAVGNLLPDSEIVIGSVWASEQEIPAVAKPYTVQLLHLTGTADLEYYSKDTVWCTYNANTFVCDTCGYACGFSDSNSYSTSGLPAPVKRSCYSQYCKGTGTLTFKSLYTANVTEYYIKCTFPNGRVTDVMYAVSGSNGNYWTGSLTSQSLCHVYYITEGFAAQDKTTFDTFMSKYGPSSGYVMNTDIYTLTQDLNVTQRLKLWDAGCYGSKYSNDAYRTYCVQGTNTYNGNTQTADSHYNYTTEGIAYKLTQMYGEDNWVYVGTPS